MALMRITLLLLLLVSSLGASARTVEPLQVAVASNFKRAFTAIASRFEAEYGHPVVATYGATGKHYAQILQGAPFDLFLAADTERPRQLERAGIALSGSRITYAEGRLALWGPNAHGESALMMRLKTGRFKHLAIANPRFAPYGRAAQEALDALDLWEQVSDRLVRGENVAQAYQFVSSGNADLGLVAYAQLIGDRHADKQTGAYTLIPDTLHQPIRQQAVLLSNRPAARQLHLFLTTPAIQQLLVRFGYAPPERKRA
ncbi:molybdate ABC transporter substrate-binding protein [Motiliproteus sp. SC1-56]|uniref:molybdate ABC transporter substrate-binding protein n=1 Tax=Motiliproteus sp. SC1-56 TaxID=2799565 RepID=UPI001A8CA139|nr:molybdate ABC transporter substrate-binding protein [Motiliproteus sp. SC1-56]